METPAQVKNLGGRLSFLHTFLGSLLLPGNEAHLDNLAKLKPNLIVRGSLLAEPVQIIVVVPMGDSVKVIGKGLRTSQVHELVLSPEQIASLEITPEKVPFNGDASHFRAARLGGFASGRLFLVGAPTRVRTTRGTVCGIALGVVPLGARCGRHARDAARSVLHTEKAA